MGESDVVRSGGWVPIVVDLELVGQSEFFGTVRVGQRDVDGDECYDSVSVHLREESGGAQRVMLYALANPHAVGNRGRFVVELFDADVVVVAVALFFFIGIREVLVHGAVWIAQLRGDAIGVAAHGE